MDPLSHGRLELPILPRNARVVDRSNRLDSKLGVVLLGLCYPRARGLPAPVPDATDEPPRLSRDEILPLEVLDDLDLRDGVRWRRLGRDRGVRVVSGGRQVLCWSCFEGREAGGGNVEGGEVGRVVGVLAVHDVEVRGAERAFVAAER